MSKKKQKTPADPAQKPIEDEALAPAGARLMIFGVMTLAAGFFLLSRSDAMGKNWAGVLSPYLILAGYGLVGLGVFWQPGSSQASPQPPQA